MTSPSFLWHVVVDYITPNQYLTTLDLLTSNFNSVICDGRLSIMISPTGTHCFFAASVIPDLTLNPNHYFTTFDLLISPSFLWYVTVDYQWWSLPQAPTVPSLLQPHESWHWRRPWLGEVQAYSAMKQTQYILSLSKPWHMFWCSPIINICMT